MAGRGSFRHSFPPSQRAGGSCTVSRSQREEEKVCPPTCSWETPPHQKRTNPKVQESQTGSRSELRCICKTTETCASCSMESNIFLMAFFFFFGIRLYFKRNMQFLKRNNVNSNFKSILHCHKIIIYWITWQQTFERELPRQHDASLFLAINDHFKKAG